MKLPPFLTAASHGNGRCPEVTTERWYASNGKFVKLQDKPQELPVDWRGRPSDSRRRSTLVKAVTRLNDGSNIVRKQCPPCTRVHEDRPYPPGLHTLTCHHGKISPDGTFVVMLVILRDDVLQVATFVSPIRPTSSQKM